MAIVVLHHLKDDGTAYGRGDKLFNADTTIEISSTGDGGTLHSPRQIKLGLKHRFVKCEQETKPFTIMLNDENKWVVVDPPYTESEMAGILKKGYGLKNAELADLLGISERKAGDITRKEK